MKKLFFLMLLLAVGCSSGDDAEVYIRLENVSAHNYENIIVRISNDPLDYGNLGTGKVSEYQMVTKAYRYAYVELEINGKMYILQPIDYVGESTLGSGYYTYQIDAEDGGWEYGQLSISLVED
ncbi:hypothetical protein [Flagellimonas oceanensis]|uniref:hypothetical protein n=1 Tax=Flagellimonas oceanensis TaxID=2499163 RepID=UPI000F8CA980|nr:hypothetical protein [Allomuricauda oceanensis]|tara:strand:- start:4387 stop:4755 length:369 start_codon:yes stop_codon:yes gene_type:complete